MAEARGAEARGAGRLAPPVAFTESVTVRYSDTDAQGHLYFANYMIYADEVAGSYMESLGLSAMDPQRAPCFMFTVNINCDFLGECRAGERVRVSVGYARLGGSSAELAFYLVREGSEDGSEEALAAGSLTQVFVDKDTRRPCGVPGAYREAILRRQPELAG